MNKSTHTATQCDNDIHLYHNSQPLVPAVGRINDTKLRTCFQMLSPTATARFPMPITRIALPQSPTPAKKVSRKLISLQTFRMTYFDLFSVHPHHKNRHFN